MNSTTVLEPAEIRRKVSSLCLEFEQAREQAGETERDGRGIDRKIYDLQARCPHKNTKKDFVQDGAEMKLRNFCTDCGAQC